MEGSQRQLCRLQCLLRLLEMQHQAYSSQVRLSAELSADLVPWRRVRHFTKGSPAVCLQTRTCITLCQWQETSGDQVRFLLSFISEEHQRWFHRRQNATPQ